MIDHISIPVSNLKQSREFYEKAFLPLGFRISFGAEGRFWAFDLLGKGLFEIYQERDSFTKIHVAFRVKSISAVHEFYREAMQAGAKDHGAPGPRPQYSPAYYASFVLDPDGHNIEAVHHRREAE